MNDLEKHVLQIIGEDTTSPDVFSDITPIRDSVNSAVQELCALTGSYVQPYHMPLYANRRFYRMGWVEDHFGYILDVFDRIRKRKLGRTDLYSLATRNPWFMKDTGPPDMYFEVGHSVVGFDKEPTTDGKVLELTCVAIPKAVATDSDPIKLRDVFRRAAAHYATSEFYASRGDAVRAKEWFSQYLEAAGLMNLHPEQAERMYQMGGFERRWEPSTNR